MSQPSSESIKAAQRAHFDGVSDSYTEAVGEQAYHHYVGMTISALSAELSRRFADLSDISGVDVGCGMGNLVSAMGERCGAMTGFDISSGMIDAARRAHGTKSNLTFGVAPSDALDLPDRSVDFSMTVYLLHHLAEEDLIAGTFAEMKRVTRDGGTIIVVDVNTLNPLSPLRQRISVARGVDTGLEKLIPARRAIGLLEKLDIEVTTYRGIGFVPHIFGWLLPCNDLIGKVLPHKLIGKDYILAGKVRH